MGKLKKIIIFSFNIVTFHIISGSHPTPYRRAGGERQTKEAWKFLTGGCWHEQQEDQTVGGASEEGGTPKAQNAEGTQRCQEETSGSLIGLFLYSFFFLSILFIFYCSVHLVVHKRKRLAEDNGEGRS